MQVSLPQSQEPHPALANLLSYSLLRHFCWVVAEVGQGRVSVLNRVVLVCIAGRPAHACNLSTHRDLAASPSLCLPRAGIKSVCPHCLAETPVLKRKERAETIVQEEPLPVIL